MSDNSGKYDLNECTFEGKLTRQPMLRYLGDGKAMINMNIKVENGKSAMFLPVTLFGPKAETINDANLDAGDTVRVSGRLGTYKREKDGVTTWNYSLTAESVERTTGSGKPNRQSQSDDDGDFPF